MKDTSEVFRAVVISPRHCTVDIGMHEPFWAKILVQAPSSKKYK